MDQEDLFRLLKLNLDLQAELGRDEARRALLSYIEKNWKSVKYLYDVPHNLRAYEMLLVIDGLQFAEHRETKFLYCWHTSHSAPKAGVIQRTFSEGRKRKVA